MKGFVHVYNLYVKSFEPHRRGEACRWADIVSYPLFANVFKNNITISVKYIIVRLLKIE